MPDALSAADEAVLQRRGFLRGGALLAAAAGGAVAATAGSVLPASASPLPAAGTFMLAIAPTRLLDTKTAGTRSVIVASSSANALSPSFRLRKNAWIDVSIGASDVAFDVAAVFVNLTSLSSLKSGYLTVSAPGDRPSATTLYHGKGQTVSNSAVVPVDVVDGDIAVRIFATATTHVRLDITGVSLFGDSTEPALRKAARTDAERFSKAVQAAGR